MNRRLPLWWPVITVVGGVFCLVMAGAWFIGTGLLRSDW